jgi:hypothetical protein
MAINTRDSSHSRAAVDFEIGGVRVNDWPRRGSATSGGGPLNARATGKAHLPQHPAQKDYCLIESALAPARTVCT